MDIIDRHFAAENAHDVAATLATYTDDIVWDDITHPDSPFSGKEAVGSVYSGIIDAIPDVHLESVKRIDAGTTVIDESILTGHVARLLGRTGRWWRSRSGEDPPHLRDQGRADQLRERLVQRRRGDAPGRGVDGEPVAMIAGIRRWLRSVAPERATLGKDALAGLTGAIGSVPDGMAAAVLAGVNPVHGLYASFAGRLGGGFTSSTTADDDHDH